MDRNEVTKHFSVGNTLRQATMHARILRPNMNNSIWKTQYE